MGKRATVIATGMSLALLTAVPAASASPRSYANGDYAGRVAQSIPRFYAGSIGFSIRSGALTALRFKVTMVCGKILLTEVTSPPSSLHVRVHRDGTFSYSGTAGGAMVKLSGSLHGRKARGSFFESFHTTRTYMCTMYAAAPFGAGWGKAGGSGSAGSGGLGSGGGSGTLPGVGTVTGVTGAPPAP